MVERVDLGRELAKHQLAFDSTVLAQLTSYILLLDKWNKIHNITGLNNFDDMLKTHVLDSLIALKELETMFLSKKFIEVIDIGSGNGTPGIPWAIAKKEINLSLVEKNQKKTAFLHSAIQSLELNKRVKIYNKRFENLAINKIFDVVTSRALMNPESFVNNTVSFGGKKTVWLIMTTNEKMESMKEQVLKEKGLVKVLEKTYEIKYSDEFKTQKKKNYNDSKSKLNSIANDDKTFNCKSKRRCW